MVNNKKGNLWLLISLWMARTIADLEGKENIEMHHVAEAVGYRSLDRGDRAEI